MFKYKRKSRPAEPFAPAQEKQAEQLAEAAGISLKEAREQMLRVGLVSEKVGETAVETGTALKTAAEALSREKPSKPTSPRYRRALRRFARRQEAMTEHERIHARYQPSARELFPMLRELLLSSRPVIERSYRDGKVTGGGYGPPTFRNVLEIDEDGKERLL